MTDEDLRAALVHLKKFNDQKPCPVCGGENFSLEGPMVLVRHPPTVAALSGKDAIPVLVAVCTSCFFMRQFAWVPIRNAQPPLVLKPGEEL